MPLVPVQLPPGLERNGTPYETPGRWWDMALMRWVSGSTMPVGGWQRLTETPLDSSPRRILTWRDNTNTRGVLVGTDYKLYTDWGNYTDITPSDLVPPVPNIAGGYGTGPYGSGNYGVPRPPSDAYYNEANALWSMDVWGEDVYLVASSDGRLFHYVRANPTTAPVVQVGAPTGNTAVMTTNERYVVLMGTTSMTGTDAGTFYPRRICWCSQEDPTDWNFSSVTNTAGFLDLDATSPLLRGVRVLGGYLILSSTDVFYLQYEGPPYIYGAQKIGKIERLHPYTVATWDGKAMWWSSRGFQIFAGGYVQPIQCPIFADLLAEADPTWTPVKAHSGHNGAYPEVWFFYPSIGNSECDRYIAYNYLENYWHWGPLARSAMIGAGATPRPLMGGSDGHMYDHENGWTNAGIPILGGRYLESGALGIGDGMNTVEVTQAMLATDSPGCVNISFYGRFTPDGNERVFGPYVPRGDGYTDTRVNAREARIRYTSTTDNIYSFGTLRLNVAAGGTR